MTKFVISVWLSIATFIALPNSGALVRSGRNLRLCYLSRQSCYLLSHPDAIVTTVTKVVQSANDVEGSGPPLMGCRGMKRGVDENNEGGLYGEGCFCRGGVDFLKEIDNI